MCDPLLRSAGCSCVFVAPMHAAIHSAVSGSQGSGWRRADRHCAGAFAPSCVPLAWSSPVSRMREGACSEVRALSQWIGRRMSALAPPAHAVAGVVEDAAAAESVVDPASPHAVVAGERDDERRTGVALGVHGRGSCRGLAGARSGL